MLDVSVLVELVQVEAMCLVIWVGGDTTRCEDGGDERREVDSLRIGQSFDGHGFGDVSAIVRQDVMVCESIEGGTRGTDCVNVSQC